ncbi:MAG: hypothetical protein KTR35_03390 [Gammaproteobacteria bacterium]|nr:hypothetical protein [Gammaproteobacteria bacterium]
MVQVRQQDRPVDMVKCLTRISLVLALIGVCLSQAQAADVSLGPFDAGVYSGTPPFNTTGTCTDSGDDCGDTDNRVRTGDLIHFSWSVSVSGVLPSEPPVHSVILEQTIRPDADADVELAKIPVICLSPPQGPGGESPSSSLTINPDRSITLMCNLGSMGNGEQKSFAVSVRPLASSADGATFTTEQRVYGLDSGGNITAPSVSYFDSNTYAISAAPAFDIDETQRPMYKSYVANYNVGAGSEPGYVMYFTAHVAADSVRAAKGMQELANTFTFGTQITATEADGVTPYSFPYRIIECRPNPSRWGNVVLGKENYHSDLPIEKKVVDSGTCAYAGDHTTGYTFTVSNADSLGLRYPTETINGTSLVNGPYFVAAYRLRVWIPFSAIDAADGVPGDGAGTIRVSNCLSDFDPLSSHGTSNYSAGVEPGYNGAAMPDGSSSNNCTGPLALTLNNTASFYHGVISSATDAGGYTYTPVVPSFHTGTGSVEPGVGYGHFPTLYNNGGTSLANAELCSKFDNTVSRLVERSAVGIADSQYAFIGNHTYAGFDRTEWQIEYGTADFGSDNPIDGDADGTPDFNSSTNRYEGDWQTMRGLNCDDPSIVNWSTDPLAVGLDDINVIRVSAIDPLTTSLEPAHLIRLILPLNVRNEFYGGPNDGELIPVGTVAAAFSTYRSDNLHNTWRNAGYRPSPESTHSDGDRVTITKVSVDVTQSTLIPLAANGVVESILAGNSIVWHLQPSVYSTASAGGTARNMQVRNILPEGVEYSSDCTQATSGATLPDLIEPNTPSVGLTRLTWYLGDIDSSNPIDPIVFCTDTDTLLPAGTLVTAQASALADSALESDSSDHGVLVDQAGAIQADVIADVQVDPVDDSQVHTLRFNNYAVTSTLDAPTLINVLPFNGDGVGLSARLPESSFSGTLELTGEAVVTFRDGSVPTGVEPAIGELLYTADTASTVDHRPDANSSGWCTFTAGTFNPQSPSSICPTSFGEVTAIKFVSNYELDIDGSPRQGMQLTYTLQASGNTAGDRYTNTFGIDSDSLPVDQYVKAQRLVIDVASHSVGDFVFIDIDDDGRYSPTTDQLAPDGTTVNLRNALTDALVGTTQTIGGHYLFDLLSQGDYYIQIPTSLFALGQPFMDWSPAANGQPANDDANQHIDHSAQSIYDVRLDGVRSDTISLSSTPPVNASQAPAGDEPLGDNSFGIADINTNDDFSNLTIDLGLKSGDADSDTIPDWAEYGPGGLLALRDFDGDGAGDFLDSDSDGDGISDRVEVGASALTPRDTDSDGWPDYHDRDSDNDLIPDAFEASGDPENPTDTDNDGTPDYRDLDSDADGVPDRIEASVSAIDSDSDGIVDAFDVQATGGMDVNFDGIDDSVSARDSDADGLADFRDEDSDGDSIPDSTESTNLDTDGDGAIDRLDWDADGDGVPDLLEAKSDTDNDGLLDYLDLDSDNDGIPDAMEAQLSQIDSDGDGVDDAFDVDVTGGNDSNLDGIDDAFDLIDSDGDGIKDGQDLDSDNDGLTDTFEASGRDLNGDGIVDGWVDTNNDGLHDLLSGGLLDIPDTDADSLADYIDRDADNDGLPDLAEANGVDVDRDGEIDNFQDNNGDGLDDVIRISRLMPPDTDSDSVLDFRDADSDSDGISDRVEGMVDSDGDLIPDFRDSDSDDDGILDIVEGAIDTDSDGIPDYLDPDSDNDGLTDVAEGTLDRNNSGVPDYIELPDSLPDTTDTDNDGIPDRVEGIGDSDGDGIPDYRDTDSDNDGIPDSEEQNNDFDADGVPDYLDSDSDGDGVPDSVEGNTDSDNDGIPNQLDLDSNGDGVSDAVEGASDQDGDGIPNNLDSDADNDGIPNWQEYGSDPDNPVDTDQDGIADFLDSDSDNDGIPDLFEAGGDDTDGNGLIDGFIDINRNGLDDSLEVQPLTLLDTDNDGVQDRHDLDSDNDGLSDLMESQEQSSDRDNDGRVDTFIDSDNNGMDDRLQNTPRVPDDIDGDSMPDHLDLDTDGDGVFDIVEAGGVDLDGDGQLPAFDSSDGFTRNWPDLNNNGIADVEEAQLAASGAVAATEVGPVSTGVRAGGCRISAPAHRIDPLMPLLLLIAGLSLCFRRKTLRIDQSVLKSK